MCRCGRKGEELKRLKLSAPIFARFTEGFDTKDLREAQSLLENLHASPPE
jgi:hypothetical protein